MLKQRQKIEKAAKPEIPVLTIDNEDAWHVTKEGKNFVVAGKRIERFAARTDFDNPAGVERLRDIMRKMGIAHELERQGVEANTSVKIGNNTINW